MTSKYDVFSWVAVKSPIFGVGNMDILILAIDSDGISKGEAPHGRRVTVRSASPNRARSNVTSGCTFAKDSNEGDMK